jgi:hypothetical protein
MRPSQQAGQAESSAPAKIKRRTLYRVAILGSIRADEVLPARELMRRMAWGRKAIKKAEDDGLRAIRYGRGKVYLGSDVVAFFQGLAERERTRESMPSYARQQ